MHVAREPEQAANHIAANALEILVEYQLMTNFGFHNRIIVFGVPIRTNSTLRWYQTWAVSTEHHHHHHIRNVFSMS